MQQQEKSRGKRIRVQLLAGTGIALDQESLAEPEHSDRRFFTAEDRPKMEALMHNLEHGHTATRSSGTTKRLARQKKTELQELAKVTNTIDAALDKFIVSAWDPAYGKFPVGKKFALSHWSATPGADQGRYAAS